MPPRTQQLLIALDRRREVERDIDYRHFVRPDGVHAAIVTAFPGGMEFPVASSGQTVRPGVVLPTGSNTGKQGEFLLATPPPGRHSSAVPIIRGEVFEGPVTGVLTIDPPGPEIAWTNESGAKSVDLVGTGLNRFMQITIFNESTPGFFTFLQPIVSAFHTAATLTFSTPSFGSESADVRIQSGGVTLEFEDALTAQII